jgi:phage terminase small subunit
MTLKQKMFIKKYIEFNGNATKAALEVYNVKNRNTAGAVGSRLLRNVKVKEEISRIIEIDKSFLPYIIGELKDLIENGDCKQQAEAIKLGFKLLGAY